MENKVFNTVPVAYASVFSEWKKKKKSEQDYFAKTTHAHAPVED